MIRKIGYSFGILLILLLILALRPVRILPADECEHIHQRVEKIHEGPGFDIVIRLQGDDTYYYINRGLEQGLNLRDLQSQLTGKEVQIYYPWHWTPLDPYSRIVHISKLIQGETVIFDETPS